MVAFKYTPKLISLDDNCQYMPALSKWPGNALAAGIIIRFD